MSMLHVVPAQKVTVSLTPSPTRSLIVSLSKGGGMARTTAGATK